MKKLLFGLTLLASMSSFASMHCSIAMDSNGDGNFSTNLALYSDMDTSKSRTIMTLINPDGSVVKNYDFSDIYDGVKDEAEINARTAAVAGGQIVLINIEQELGQVSLSTANLDNLGASVEFNADAMTLGDLDTSKLALFNMNKGISVFCANQ
jgi:hypothetical protein